MKTPSEPTRVLFVCHGNICRSPMAEFVFRDMARKRGLTAEFFIASAATSDEEIGNRVHPGTLRKLVAEGIPADPAKRAARLTRADYGRFDRLIGMDAMNVRNMRRMLPPDDGAKICRLLDFTGRPRDIADPWYTGDFDETYRDVAEGCEALLDALCGR